MSFFSDRYLHVKYPHEVIDEGGNSRGLRKPQIAAIHTIAAHFAVNDGPAIVVMPTGSGKTAVLMMAAFVLQAKRVLVITPSQLVRGQIKEKFETLDDLCEAGVLSDDCGKPRVTEVRSKLKSTEEWELLREFDVVIGIPNSVSPENEGVAQPPDDLFDLILVDEAHHSPAKTWSELFKAFPNAKRTLFTATPFRRDQKEIHGDFIFTYSVKQAYEDKIFGKIRFIPVKPDAGQDHDAVIARQAETELLEDRDAGYDHFLMVRTDRKTRADALLKIYSETTGLKLKVVHSDLANSTVKKVINELKLKELDGVICVNMLGEGFDFPNLKIAAVHTPHKSLEVTLQFIGRFARTKGEKIGKEAKFVGIPADLEIEATRIYKEGAAWEEIIPNLSEARVVKEVQTWAALGYFKSPLVSIPLTKDLSLFSLHPAYHVKIYRIPTEANPDLESEIRVELPLENVFQRYDPSSNAVAIITKQDSYPKWSQSSQLRETHYNLFVIYFDEASRLLFINSSSRNDSIYQFLIDTLTGGVGRLLPGFEMHRVLRDLQRFQVFNLGMRNQMVSQNETYQIKAGANAHNAVTEVDGVQFSPGHVFVSAEKVVGESGVPVTIGYSGGSKIWSLRNSRIPQFIAWCRQLADAIQSDAPVETNSNLDHLRVGTRAQKIPVGALAAQWDSSAFRSETAVCFADGQGEEKQISLVDLDVVIDRENSNEDQITLSITAENRVWPMIFSLPTDGNGTLFRSQLAPNDIPLWIRKKDDELSLLSYLNGNPLSFYFADFSRLHGEELFPAPTHDFTRVDGEKLKVIDWVEAGVTITKEFYEGTPPTGALLSLHDYLFVALATPEYTVVIYDHGQHEVADFIAFAEDEDDVTVTLYHCKKSGENAAGNRVEDIYEVCGQAIKSIRWCNQNGRLIKKLRHRIRVVGSRFVSGKGDITELDALFERMKRKSVHYEIIVVQPGLSKKLAFNQNMEILSACSHYVLRNASASVSFLVSE